MDAEDVKVVERFLESVDQDSSEVGLSPRELERQLNLLERKLRSARGVKRLSLLQRREDLRRIEFELAARREVEERATALLAEYASEQGISYSTLREYGLSKTLLDQAGVKRSRRVSRKT